MCVNRSIDRKLRSIDVGKFMYLNLFSNYFIILDLIQKTGIWLGTDVMNIIHNEALNFIQFLFR